MLAAQVQTETKVLLGSIDTIMRSAQPYIAKLHIREVIQRNVIN
jgi:hypothetical protein